MSKNAHTAELIEGRTYTLMVPSDKEPRKSHAMQFSRGSKVPVNEDVKRHLEQHAFDRRPTFRAGNQIGSECIQKFKFAPISELKQPRKEAA